MAWEPADQRAAVLLRASALFDLVEAGMIDLDDAVDALEHAIHMIRPCTCERETLDAWKRHDQKRREQAFMDWRWRR
jgi:hypothetical protein